MKLIISLFFIFLISCENVSKNDVVNHVHEATPWIREPLLILTVITAIGGFGLALFDIIHYLSSDIDHLKMKGLVYTLDHAFLPSDMNTRIIGWTTIVLSFIIGPIIAARVHGGKLQEGERAIPIIGWLVSLSSKFGSQNVDNMSKSQFSEALQNRLYFDDFYEYLISKTVIPFANFSAWFDRIIIDGIIKQVESKSVSGSLEVRKITTGSARDYILMAAVGMISIFILIWGVS